MIQQYKEIRDYINPSYKTMCDNYISILKNKEELSDNQLRILKINISIAYQKKYGGQSVEEIYVLLGNKQGVK